MATKPNKPKPILFSYIDRPAKNFVEAVWTGTGIRYLVKGWDTGETAFFDEYLIKDKDIVVVPPGKDHPFIAKQGIMLPRFEEEQSTELNEDQLDKDIDSFVDRWLLVPRRHIVALKAFVKFTWVHERSFIKPYLNVWGNKGTGKSTVVEAALQWLCRHAVYYAGGVTPAALVRQIDSLGGTSIIDEADWLKSADAEQILMILRSGYKTTGTYSVAETDGGAGKRFSQRIFSTGNPKIILGREVIRDDALRSRCLEIEMKPQPVPPEKRRPTGQWFAEDLKDRAQSIVDRLLLYRLNHLNDQVDTDPEFLKYEARLSDTSQALFTTISEPEDKKLYLEFVNQNVGENLDQLAGSMDGQVLECLKEMLELAINQPPAELFDGKPKVFLADIINKYKEKFGSDWSEQDLKKQATTYNFGRRLKKMGIKTHRYGGVGRIVDPESFGTLSELYSRYGIKSESQSQNDKNLENF